MYNVVGMNRRESCEEGAKVDGHIGDGHIAEVIAEVMVWEVGENSDDLIGRAKGGNQGADGRAVAKIVEELKFVEDADGRGCYVNLLDCDVLGSPGWLSLEWLGTLIDSSGGRASTDMAFQGRWCPFLVLFVEIPSIVVSIVLQVCCFVDGRECTYGKSVR